MTTALTTGVRGTSLEPGEKEGDFVLNMGPQHPSTHGVLRVILKTAGETVVWCDSDIGYLHRGHEKTGENLPYVEFTPYTDRLDYLAAPAMNLAWVEAAEKLLQIQVPERAQYIRVLIAELSRIASHLLWLGTHAMDCGALTTFLYCFREREMILDLFEAFGGARLTTHIFRIGGLPTGVPENLTEGGLPPGWLAGVEDFLKVFPTKLKEYHTLLTKNRIWLRRTKGVGYVSGPDCVAWGLSGPIIRASGIGYDLRRAQPYEVYDRLDFEVPVYHAGDVYDRYLVRMDEMVQSQRIIRQCLDQLPDGPTVAEMPKRLKAPAGEIYHAVESPRGEMGFFVVSDGAEVPYRVKVRPASFVNLQALPIMSKDALIADIVAIIGSIDIVLGEVDH
jgi:NADH-quinone oxidoreductase subunit D